MTSARRSLLLTALVLAFVGYAAWLVLAPFGLLEESAGPLDGLLPPDVDAAVRFDPATLAWSPVAESLREHPGVADLRAATGLDERVLAPLRELEDRVGRITLGLAPSVERDVLGLDAVVAVRGDDVLLLTRLTGRGKLVGSASRLDSAELRAMGLRLDGDVAILEREDAPAVRLRRVRDVLVVSTSADLLATAVALAEPPVDLVPVVSRYAEALDGARPPGTRVLMWLQPSALFGTPSAARADDMLGLARAALPPEALGTVHGAIDLGAPEHVSVTLRGAAVAEAPASWSVLADLGAGSADGLLADAERLAVPGEAFAVVGLSVHAVEAVRALADAQPPARRDLLDQVLAERDLTVDIVAERIAAHLHDGIAAVVSRLPEADALELDDPRNGGVHAIPATLVAFRLRGTSSPDAVIDALADEADALFGSPLRLTPEDAAGGARMHRLEKHRFGGEWELLRPAVAVVDGLLVFCTHEAHLRRALARRASDAAVAPADAARTLAVRMDAAPFRRHVDDQRWAWADRETRHDWRAERETIRRELAQSGSILLPEDRQVYEDERIAVRLERRNSEEFPAAIARYRAAWRPLEALAGLRLSADREGAAFRLVLDVDLAGPDDD